MEGLRFRLSPTAIHHIAIISIINFFSIVVVGLRIYSRKVTAAGLGWDDKFILLSSVLGNTLFALYCYCEFRRPLDLSSIMCIFIAHSHPSQACSAVPQYHLLIADNIGLLPTFLGVSLDIDFERNHSMAMILICNPSRSSSSSPI